MLSGDSEWANFPDTIREGELDEPSHNRCKRIPLRELKDPATNRQKEAGDEYTPRKQFLFSEVLQQEPAHQERY